jgi:uncharacterized protein YfaS (alpha-2-macroglobulin family)
MVRGDVNAARLLALALDDPAWKDDIPRLATGLIGRQQSGAWSTTTANLWASLALERFSRAYESVPVTGVTRAAMTGPAPAHGTIDWAQKTSDRTLTLPWGTIQPGASAKLSITHQGGGKPWLTLQALAAVPLKAPYAAGYRIKKTVTPVQQADKGHYSPGDVLRVTLEIDASADMTWVAVTDPIPAGSTVLGSGLGRDSDIATQGEKRSGTWPAYEERGFEGWRGYYDYLPKGKAKVEYTVRLNNPGTFQLPPTRVEALYAPEMFGETPNAPMVIAPGAAVDVGP